MIPGDDCHGGEVSREAIAGEGQGVVFIAPVHRACVHEAAVAGGDYGLIGDYKAAAGDVVVRTRAIVGNDPIFICPAGRRELIAAVGLWGGDFVIGLKIYGFIQDLHPQRCKIGLPCGEIALGVWVKAAIPGLDEKLQRLVRYGEIIAADVVVRSRTVVGFDIILLRAIGGRKIIIRTGRWARDGIIVLPSVPVLVADLHSQGLEACGPGAVVFQRIGIKAAALWLGDEIVFVVLGRIRRGRGSGLVRRDVEDAVPYRILGGGRLRRRLAYRGNGSLRFLRQGKGSGGEAQDHQQGQDKAQCAFDGFHDGSSIKNNCVRVNPSCGKFGIRTNRLGFSQWGGKKQIYT